MASSLEELLADDGFKERKPLRKSRGSFKSHATSMLNNHSREKRNPASDLDGQIRTTRSPTILRCSSTGEFQTRGGIKSSIGGDNFTNREKFDKGSSNEHVERSEGKGHLDAIEQTRYLMQSSNDKTEDEYSLVSEEGNKSFKDIYANEMCVQHGVRGEAREKEHYKKRLGKNTEVEKRRGNGLKKNLLGCMNFDHNNSTIIKLSERSYDRSNNSSYNRKSFRDIHHQSHDSNMEAVSVPALDVVAVQAMVSIINGYLKHFVKDKDFRLTLRHNSYILLNLVGAEGCNTGKVIANLEQAIDIVEQAADGSSTDKELKKASLQLSVITGLNTNLMDDFTSGIPKSKLSACAHLYLSMIFNLQKKDYSSAKHILQVFCDLPFQARTILLPELWDNLFLPHLSHLKAWYDREADTPSQSNSLTLLDKVYNEIMDSGTYKFAVYYKDWLAGGEAPVPSIAVPAVYFEGVDQESHLDDFTGITLPDDSLSPQPSVSRKLYNAVFSASKNPRAPNTECEWELENVQNRVRSFKNSNVSKNTRAYYSDTVKNIYQDTDEDSIRTTAYNITYPENFEAQKWKMYDVNILSEMDDSDEFCNSPACKMTETDFQPLNAQPHEKEIDNTIQEFARSSSQVKHTDASENLSFYDPSNLRKATFNSLENPTKVMCSLKELNDSHKEIEEKSSLLSTPKDFICPLTGQLFEDPVTLETGQSFEKSAIKAWLNQGHRTCPVTGKILESLAVPVTNFVLKRVISSWNSNRRTYLLAFLSQIVEKSGNCKIDKIETIIFVLEQFLSACSKAEAMNNAKYLVTHGYLQFLIQMFESVKMEEKTRIIPLLSCCVEVDAHCRIQVANGISKIFLVSLLHSKQEESLESVVQLLIKLICLKRRKDATSFLRGLLDEDSEETLQALLVYLRSSPPEKKPLIAVLLVHFNLVVVLQESMFMEEAVDAISIALDVSLTNAKVRESCCKAILILGGHFSLSGKLESWMLKEVGFTATWEVKSLDYKEENPEMDSKILLDDNKQANEEWFRNLAFSLVKSGKQPFLRMIFKCLAAGNLDLVGVGLATLTWFSFSLPLLSTSEFQPSALSTLICLVKDVLQNSMLVEHKILASICLLNFSKISECRLLVIALGKEIKGPLRSIARVTEAARQLYATITGEDISPEFNNEKQKKGYFCSVS